MTKIAIMYDFDQTLCTRNMQEYPLLGELGIDAPDFWKNVQEEATSHNMDPILAYMYMLVTQARRHGRFLTRSMFERQGRDIEYFPGVEEYFSRMNAYAQSLDVQLQHYIISSGTKEIIDGTSIASEFTRIYACEFHYDENGNADWPAIAINYTGKTQFLFRIQKNSLDVYDNSRINLYHTEREIPFTHMIYIADGYTDVPCMRLVKGYGGCSIAVHTENDTTCRQLVADQRVNYTALADWREGSELDLIIKKVISEMAAKE